MAKPFELTVAEPCALRAPSTMAEPYLLTMADQPAAAARVVAPAAVVRAADVVVAAGAVAGAAESASSGTVHT